MEERLQKYMARCGVASRRKCEEIILSNRVKVDGNIVKELGTKIDSRVNEVRVDDKVIKPEEKKIYIALNKPIGYISSVKDDRGRKTLLDIVKVDERIYPIGRLDYDTSGLIFLTNDGEVYNNVMHPRVSINKTYIAIVKGIINDDEVHKFEKGIDIGDYITAPGRCEVIKKYKNSCEVAITIHEGKNRQVRRMCEAIGHPVVSLKRVSIGEIKLDTGLKEGQWRYLSEIEIQYLKNGGDKDV
ncbi:pseudouridine synthase [Clostridium sp. UBA5988]|uniref:pseudouridine synthase n=1 Tax=Clostridium sp. UBA5988 TaxID=1946369 RepID=UPI003217D529